MYNMKKTDVQQGFLSVPRLFPLQLSKRVRKARNADVEVYFFSKVELEHKLIGIEQAFDEKCNVKRHVQ